LATIQIWTEATTPTTTEEAVFTIGAMTLETGSSQKWHMKCDGVAFHVDRAENANPLMVASVCGTSTTIKAFRAALCTRGAMCLSTEFDTKDFARFVKIDRSPHGYRFYAARIISQYWHAIAIAKDRRLILNLTEESLVEALHSPRLSTPFTRSWVPWIGGELIRLKLLAPIRSLQVNRPALLLAETSHFDEIVSRGLREGHLTI